MLYGGPLEYVQALNDIVILLMIEKKSAVDNLEEILSLKGIDMIQWGPADYSMSIGRPGGWHEPEVKTVERKVIKTCLKMGVPPRAEIDSVEPGEVLLGFGGAPFLYRNRHNDSFQLAKAKWRKFAEDHI
jgi:4-hydroxy-2-oxoheptanedioate aldolase